MDLGKLIAENWQVISAAPAAFIAIGLACAATGFLAAHTLYSARADTLKERLDASKEDVSRLRGEKDAMLAKLEAHGEDITTIRAELAALPRIYTSDKPPENAKDGDVWIRTRP